MTNDKDWVGNSVTHLKIIGSSHGSQSERVANDFYATHESTIDGLLKVYSLPGRIWECACGNGSLSKKLESLGYDVVSTDLVDRGYGQGGINFLASEEENRMFNENFEGFTVKELALMTKRRKEIGEILNDETISKEYRELLTLERKCYPIVRIRKLTPRECFRLMDVSEEDIDKLLTMAEKTKKGQQVLEQVLANSSLYHCAGNSIVVSCLFHIFRTLLVEEEKMNGVKAIPFRPEPKELSLFEL